MKNESVLKLMPLKVYQDFFIEIIIDHYNTYNTSLLLYKINDM